MPILFLLLISLSAFASSWQEVCRDYTESEYVEFTQRLSPHEKIQLESTFQQIEPYLPLLAQKGSCAKTLFAERYVDLVTRLKSNPSKDTILSQLANGVLEEPWTEMDTRGCLLPGPYCDPTLMQLFQKKDPTKTTLTIQNPFLNYITSGRLQPNVEFTAMNCHGTADYLAGSFLKDVELTSIKNWNINLKSACYSTVENKWNSTLDHTIGNLNPNGGVIVNMKYEMCGEDDCGTATETIRSCRENEASTFTLIDGMCVKCWAKKLRDAGFKQVQAGSYNELKSGCILTKNDHSITIIRRNRDFCYSFESTTSFGAPLFRVAPCAELSLDFPYQYCR